jgi:YD repeat-containing protein
VVLTQLEGEGGETMYSGADTAGLVFTPAIYSSYTHDALNRETGITQAVQDSSSTTRSYTYGYDAASRLTKQTSNFDGTSSYTYDNDNQLLTDSLSTESYLYDVGGNRTSTKGVADSTTNGNELTNDGTFTYAYDHEGNLITQTALDGSATLTFTWDYRDRLTSVVTKNSSGTTTESISYTYDTDNRRISQTATGASNVSEQYVYDGSNLLAVIALSFSV